MQKIASLCLAVVVGAGVATIPATPAAAQNAFHTVTADVSMRITDVDPIGRDEKGTRTFSGNALVNDEVPNARIYGTGCVDNEVGVEMELAVFHAPPNRPAGSVRVGAHAFLSQGTRCFVRTVGEARNEMFLKPNETATRSFWVHNAGVGRDKAKITYTVTNRTRS